MGRVDLECRICKNDWFCDISRRPLRVRPAVQSIGHIRAIRQRSQICGIDPAWNIYVILKIDAVEVFENSIFQVSIRAGIAAHHPEERAATTGGAASRHKATAQALDLDQLRRSRKSASKARGCQQ